MFEPAGRCKSYFQLLPCHSGALASFFPTQCQSKTQAHSLLCAHRTTVSLARDTEKQNPPILTLLPLPEGQRGPLQYRKKVSNPSTTRAVSMPSRLPRAPWALDKAASLDMALVSPQQHSQPKVTKPPPRVKPGQEWDHPAKARNTQVREYEKSCGGRT